MKSWRMAFRQGNQGYSLWPICYRYGLAAISYQPLDDTDLSHVAPNEPTKLWRQLSPTQISSLRKVAYEMKKGDVIYVKEGVIIVGKGIVKGPYQFRLSKRIVDNDGYLWPHQLPVSWERKLIPVQLKLGAEQHTVLELTPDHIAKLNAAQSSALDEKRKMQGLEGENVVRTIKFRKRNRAIIEEKKRTSQKVCEACGMSFAKQYYLNGQDCLQVHHKDPLAERDGVRVTRLDDLVLICPNCHAVTHAFEPGLTILKLKRKIR